MAVVISEFKHKDAEHRMLVHLLKHFDWEQNECFPNVGLFSWESDLLVVSKSGYLTEVEVKHSLADWRSDSKKDKFKTASFPQKIKRLYYAVPDALYEQHVQNPVEIPEYAGILAFGRQGFDRFAEVRVAQARTSASPISQQERQRLQRSLYFRFHRQYIKGVPKPAVQPAKSKGRIIGW